MELKNLFINQTRNTPLVDLNCCTGELILSGNSKSENAAELYNKVLKWVISYGNIPRRTTNLRLNLKYLNTASSIWLAKIVKVLSAIKEPESTLMIHLYFNIEELDSMEAEDLMDALNPVMDMIGTPTVSLGIKIYGTDQNSEIMKESLVLI